ncbi:MAG: hypothetical protein ACKO0Z_04020 [Betaproteobacteria bacterium]
MSPPPSFESTNAATTQELPCASSVSGMLAGGLMVVLLWTGLFYLNEWLFSAVSVSSVINWIFLPAAIRMLAVMVLGWVGVVGLFIGALLTTDIGTHSGWHNAIVIASLSALGPFVAVRSCTQWLGLGQDLSDLRPAQLLIFSVAGAVCNVVPHNVYFFFSGHTPDIFSGMVPMLVGDLLGTLLILYVASLALKLLTARVFISRS